jgi:peroxiredoxin
MRKKESFFVFLVLIMSFVCLSAQAESGGVGSHTSFGQVAINQKAPQFTLHDPKNKTVKLSDFKGKYVVLEWFNFGCPFVKKHYESGNMQKLQKEYTNKGVIWLSVCSSAPGKQGHESTSDYDRMFAEKNAAPTAILIDADGKVGHLYDAKTTPDMYVINPEGILIYAGAIDDTPGTDVSEIATAKNYVTAALDESMTGKPVTTQETKSYGCSVKY